MKVNFTFYFSSSIKILSKLSILVDAPPTKKPSTFFIVFNSLMLSLLTLPPYNTFNFISYNLKDLELDVRAEFDNDIEDVTLKKWGKVKFVSVIRTSMRRKTLFIYLVDDKENILYDFSESVVFPSDFRVNDFLFKDINNDGREDFLLILGGITDLELHKAIIYEQNKIGGFEVNVNKTKKINNKMNETNKYSVWDMFKYLRLSS